MEIYVARHGRVPANDKQVIGGRTEEELTAVGMRQAESVREQLASVDFAAIYSSNVRRAVQTANIINQSHGLKVHLDERLTEREPGNLLGKSRAEIDKSSWNSLEVDVTARRHGNAQKRLKKDEEFSRGSARKI